MWILIQVALGGAAGSVLRYLTTRTLAGALGPGFPFGTLAVNLLGCLAMGAGYALLVRRGDGHLAPFVLTGILGGFTTFSAFSLDTMLLIERGRAGLALAYVGGSVVLGLAAFLVGQFLVVGRVQ